MSKRLIDLHGHTIESDGTFTISEYIKKASDIGLAAVALTNHDTVTGVNQFMREVSKYPDLIGIPGVEFKAAFPSDVVAKPKKGKLEILAIDVKDLKPLANYQYVSNRRRKKAALKRIKLLNDLGIPITFQDITYDKKGQLREVLGRPHIAAYLYENGYIQALQDAYDKYLNAGGLAYVEQKETAAQEIGDIICQSGALRIAAHPESLKLNDNDLFHFMKTLKEQNVLDGFEVMHPSFSFEQMRTYLDIAESLNMYISGGSDFHGANKPGIEMGRGDTNIYPNGNIAVPECVLYSILNRQLPTKEIYEAVRQNIDSLESRVVEKNRIQPIILTPKRDRTG